MEAIATTPTTTVSMPIEGMTCATCANRIERVVGKVAGVSSASVNFASETLSVVFDAATVSPVDLASSVERAGFVVPTAPVRLQIGGMTCATCANRIEKVLRKAPGVATAQVNFASEIATVAITPGAITAEALIAVVERAGFRADLAQSAEAAREAKEAADAKRAHRELWMLVVAALLTAPLIAPMFLMPFGIEWSLPGWAQLALATPVQFIAGWRFYQGAFAALQAKSANMDVLVAMGTSSAFLLSLILLTRGGHLYFEGAAAIITFVRFGKWLEARAKRSTTQAVRSLMALRPDTARVRRGDKEIEVPPESVGKGEIVIVRPGERIAVDGRIIEGESQLDESLLTGESLPQHRKVGDDVTGGAINGEGLLAIETTRVGDETTLAQILAMVQDAQATKAPIQKTVDRISAIFVPIVLAASMLTCIGWLLAGAGLEQALIVSVSVMVIACPCALGLATPAALMVGTGAAARVGILIKDAQALERTREVDVVIFDKTGTLTEGKPTLREILADDEDRVLAIAAAAQLGSEHPLAEAIVKGAKERSVDLPKVSDFQALVGRGVQVTLSEQVVRVGSPRLMEEHSLDTSQWNASAEALETQGMTVVWVASDDVVIGALAIGDSPRPSSKLAIASLHKAGIQTVLLTGDNRRAANAIGKDLGVGRVVSEVLPADKAQEISQLQSQGKVVAMVGDGVNDAPALALADVSFAMATGSDVAMHTAAVTLMRPNPTLVADAISLSKATTRTIHQNLFWAFAYNSIGIPLAALGYLSPMVAGAAMAFSSVSVLANALLLRRWKPSA